MFNKWVLLLIAALIAACVFLYQSNRIFRADLGSKQVELEQARRDFDMQKDAIDRLQQDYQVQAKAMRLAQQAIDAIREQAVSNLTQIEQRNYGAEATVNAAQLQDEVNGQFKRVFDSITRISRRLN